MIKKCSFELNINPSIKSQLSKVHKKMRMVYKQTYSLMLNRYDGCFDILSYQEVLNEINKFLKINKIKSSIDQVYIDNAVYFGFRDFNDNLKKNGEIKEKSFNNFKLFNGFEIKNNKLLLPGNIQIPIKKQIKDDVIKYGLRVYFEKGKFYGSIDAFKYRNDIENYSGLSEIEVKFLFGVKRKIYPNTMKIPFYFKYIDNFIYYLFINEKETIYEQRDIPKHLKNSKVLGYLKFKEKINTRNEMEKLLEEKKYKIVEKI